MGLRQTTDGPPEGNRLTMPVSCQTPSRLGPNHCGQSTARVVGAPNAEHAKLSQTNVVNPWPWKRHPMRLVLQRDNLDHQTLLSVHECNRYSSLRSLAPLTGCRR